MKVSGECLIRGRKNKKKFPLLVVEIKKILLFFLIIFMHSKLLSFDVQLDKIGIELSCGTGNVSMKEYNDSILTNIKAITEPLYLYEYNPINESYDGGITLLSGWKVEQVPFFLVLDYSYFSLIGKDSVAYYDYDSELKRYKNQFRVSAISAGVRFEIPLLSLFENKDFCISVLFSGNIGTFFTYGYQFNITGLWYQEFEFLTSESAGLYSKIGGGLSIEIKKTKINILYEFRLAKGRVPYYVSQDSIGDAWVGSTSYYGVDYSGSCIKLGICYMWDLR